MLFQESIAVVKVWGTSLVVVLLAVAGASAQTPQQSEAEQVRARQRISMMERVLEGAVSNGAENLLRQVKMIVVDTPMLTGAPRVRGFRLEQYGVFFDVEVPALRFPVSWALRYMVDENGMAAHTALAEIKAVLERLASDARERDLIEKSVRRLERQIGPAQPRQVAESVRSRGGVSAAVVAPPAAPLMEPDPSVVNDPNQAYTREVKAALIDAMLENSGPIALGPEEWLTVAARDNVPPDPLIPGDTTELNTIMFRIKGSDLAAFRAERITLEEARRRVDVREY